MKMKLHTLIRTAVLGLALGAYTLPLWAGSSSLPQVSVGPYSASGSMAGARFSTDSQQYIGCSFSNLAGPYVVCSAMDAAGKALFCTSTQTRHARVVKAMTDSSTITFTVNVATCDLLRVDNDSSYLK